MNKLFKEFKDSLIKHLEMYPLMQAEDVYKLAFQFSFGPGHFFINENEARKRIFEEAKELKCEGEIYIETVGNGYYRYPIVDNPIYLENVLEDFINTVKMGQPNNVNFEELLNNIAGYLKDLKSSFNYDDFLNLIKITKEKGYPAISHSEKYRNAYNPHYRLIKGVH